MKRILAWMAGVTAMVAVAGYAAMQLSPWPAALFYGFFMDRSGRAMNEALQRHVPPGVTALLDQEYDTGARLDIYHPAQADRPLPTIVWVHGGGFFSGGKDQVANYVKILAARGYVAVSVGYTLGPTKNYPTPVVQLNSALDYLMRHAGRLRIDPSRLYLAGDSAGAQIAAQLANVVSVPSYAAAVKITPSITRAQLRGVILHCGVYDLSLARFDGGFGHFMHTAMWAYSGRKDGMSTEHLGGFSVARFVTPEFPPAFISAGNADPLLPHSLALAAALRKQGVKVDTLFFSEDYKPPLPHEYQFNLDTDAGREALQRALKFIEANRD